MNLGPSFSYDLAAAGLLGLPIAWTSEGVNFGDTVNLDGSVTANPNLSPGDRAAIEAVVAAHDPEAPAPIPVPRVVSRWQGREAMRLTKHGATDLFSAAEVLLARPETPPYYRAAWDELQQFEFDSPMLLAIADELGLTYEGRAQLFRFAATLRA